MANTKERRTLGAEEKTADVVVHQCLLCDALSRGAAAPSELSAFHSFKQPQKNHNRQEKLSSRHFLHRNARPPSQTQVAEVIFPSSDKNPQDKIVFDVYKYYYVPTSAK